MNCLESVEKILTMIPTDMPILTIQGDATFNTIYVSAQRNTGEVDAISGQPIIEAAVYRHCLTSTQVVELESLLLDFVQWKKHLPAALARMNTHPASDRTSPTSPTSPISSTSPTSSSPLPQGGDDPGEVEFEGLVEKMSELLNPVVSIAAIMNVLRKGTPKHCVMCVDMRLQGLPIELIPSIAQWKVVASNAGATAGATAGVSEDESSKTSAAVLQEQVTPPALSRDFSLHVLSDRLISSGAVVAGPPVTPSTVLSTLQFIVDARNEDRPDSGMTESASPAMDDAETLMTVAETFARFSDTGWSGVQGKDTVPSWAVWQKTLSAASGGGCFLSYGLGPCLAHFPPERLAGLSMSSSTAGGSGGGSGGVRLAMLVGRSSTEESLRRLAKLANKKSAASIKLEGSVETSVLMTLAGVDTVLVNGWAASLSANRRLMLGVMNKLTAGLSIAESVGSAMEKDAVMDASGASSGSGGGKKSGGKKKKEEEDSEVVPHLKLRVRSNPIVFGLPHVLAKK